MVRFRLLVPLAVIALLCSSLRLASARVPVAGTTASPMSQLLFVPNVGQFDANVRFQAHQGGMTLWLTDTAVWLTVMEHGEPRLARQDHTPTIRGPQRGVNLKLTIPAVDVHAHWQAVYPQLATSNYLLGNDAEHWHTEVPSYGTVRWVGVRPGINLRLQADGAGLGLHAEASPSMEFPSLQFRVDGAERLQVDATGRLIAETAIGSVRLPMLFDGTGLLRRPYVAGHEATFGAPATFHDQAATTPAVPSSRLGYSTFLGAGGDDEPFAVKVAADGSTYIAGETDAPFFPTTPGVFDRTYNSHAPGFAGDVFVTKLAPDGATLIYSTLIGGYDTDRATSLVLAATGEVYVAGYTYSNNFPTTPGAYQQVFNGGCCDVFIAKLNARGSQLIYSTFLGGENFDDAEGLAVGADGTAYVTGQTLSTQFPTTPGAYDTTSNGVAYSDAFVSALNAQGGALVFSTYLGGSYNDYGEGLAVGRDGSVYVTGRTQALDFPTTLDAFDTTPNGGDGDGFVAKLDARGQQLVYSTYLGGNDYESGYAIAVDSSGAAYIAGSTVSANFPTTTGAYDRRCGSCAVFSDDGFVTKLTPSGGALVYSTFLGGNGFDTTADLVVGPYGSVYIVGSTSSMDFPTTPDALSRVLGGAGGDTFVTKLDARGMALQYSTFLGGSGQGGGYSYEFGRGVDVQGDHTIYVTGVTGSRDFPTTPGAYDTTYNGNDDGFVTKVLIPY